MHQVQLASLIVFLQDQQNAPTLKFGICLAAMQHSTSSSKLYLH